MEKRGFLNSSDLISDYPVNDAIFVGTGQAAGDLDGDGDCFVD